MSKVRITPAGFTVSMSYDTDEAYLNINAAGKVAQFDEEECDRLLRVVEYSAMPVDDLAETFEIDFGRLGGRVALAFIANAKAIAKEVYL